MNNPRYIISYTGLVKIYADESCKEVITEIQCYAKHERNCKPVYVDILSKIKGQGICHPVKVKAFAINGDIFTGWTNGSNIDLYGTDCLYDGRFNSDKL